jgi:hypothetical protein
VPTVCTRSAHGVPGPPSAAAKEEQSRAAASSIPPKQDVESVWGGPAAPVLVHCLLQVHINRMAPPIGAQILGIRPCRRARPSLRDEALMPAGLRDKRSRIHAGLPRGFQSEREFCGGPCNATPHVFGLIPQHAELPPGAQPMWTRSTRKTPEGACPRVVGMSKSPNPTRARMRRARGSPGNPPQAASRRCLLSPDQEVHSPPPPLEIRF